MIFAIKWLGGLVCAQIRAQNMPNMAKYGQICIFGAYLGAPNMVKWGVPEKIYGSIMLKICVCHFFTKLHPFFTYEGRK